MNSRPQQQALKCVIQDKIIFATKQRRKEAFHCCAFLPRVV